MHLHHAIEPNAVKQYVRCMHIWYMYICTHTQLEPVLTPSIAKSFPMVKSATAEQAKVGLPTTDVSVVVPRHCVVFLYKKTGWQQKMEPLDLHVFLCVQTLNSLEGTNMTCWFVGSSCSNYEHLWWPFSWTRRTEPPNRQCNLFRSIILATHHLFQMLLLQMSMLCGTLQKWKLAPAGF